MKRAIPFSPKANVSKVAIFLYLSFVKWEKTNSSLLAYNVEQEVGFEPTWAKLAAYKTAPIDHYGTPADLCVFPQRQLRFV